MAGLFDYFRRRGAKQDDSSALRNRAIAEIKQTWSVDDADVTPQEHGFDWLPGSHTVRVRIWKDIETPGAERCRIIISTDLLRELPPPDTMFVRHASLLASLHCPTYAVVYPSEAILKQYYDGRHGDAKLFASAYIYEHLGTEWIPAFLARMSILQPIYSESQSTTVPEILGGGQPAFAQGGKRKTVNGVLNTLRDLIIPEGKKPNRWVGSSEFEAYANIYGNDDECFSLADDQGMTLQTSFGSQYAAIMFHTDQLHRLLGNGLSIKIGLLSHENFDEACARAAHLNFLESVAWTEFPQLGCWHHEEFAENATYLVHTCFVPNAFFKEGLIRHLADWSRARVKQARRSIKPNVRDLPISEILRP